MAITQPGPKFNKPGQEVAEDEGEESDEYEVPDEEDEEDDDDSGDEEEEGGGLTAMLLGESTGDGGTYDEDEGWVPAGGKEPADYSGEEDEDEHPVSTEQAPGMSSNGAASSASSGGQKRARENDPAEDESREEKKFKLPTDPRH